MRAFNRHIAGGASGASGTARALGLGPMPGVEANQALMVLGELAVVVKTDGIPFWGRCTTHFNLFLVEIVMFTEGTGV